MRVIATTKRPCNLEGCEVRRVSQDRRFPLVGYHVCCPRCGFVTIAFQNHEGLMISEGTTPDELTFSTPLRCIYCGIQICIDHGALTLEADDHVRNVRFR